MARPKWQEDAQALADATGKVFVVGVRPNKDHSWFANCDGVEWDGSSPQMAVRQVVGTLRRRFETEAHEAARRAEVLRKVEARLDELGVV